MLPLLKLSEKLSLYPRKIHNFSLSKNTLIQKIPSLKNSKSIYLLYQNYLSKNIVTLNMQSMTSFSKKFLLWKIRNRCIFFSKIVCQRTSLLWICDRWPAFPKTFFSEEFEIYIYIYLLFQSCLSKNIVLNTIHYFEYDRWPALPKNFFSEQFEIDISSLSKLSRNTVSHDR